MIPTVAPSIRAELTWAGVIDGFRDRRTAAAPATWGEAIDVPDSIRSAVSEEKPAEVTLTPGA